MAPGDAPSFFLTPDLRDMARSLDDPVAWALAGTIWSGIEHHMQPAFLLRGLVPDELDAIARQCLAPLTMADMMPNCGHRLPEAYDEFDELLGLLLRHARDDSARVRWLAHALATACMYENHLWQDLHLPARAVLGDLLHWGFPTLAARNTGNMKWKKFFYKQLCDTAEVQACKSPVCSQCSDYGTCFGAEEHALAQAEAA